MTMLFAPEDLPVAPLPAWPWGDLEPRSYSLVMIDCPWTFRTYSPKGWGKSAQSHYGCMTMDDIAALPVRELAAEDCLVWCWATAPLLDQQLAVLKGWGARYVTTMTWVKTTAKGNIAFGTGYVARSAHEPVLIGAFGRPKIASRSVRSVFLAPAREHSRKPDLAYDIARQLIPYGRAADVFSRERRAGWDAFGNETDKFEGGCRMMFLDGRVTLMAGDCRDVLAALPDASVDSIVTDPPYGLGFMGKAWDAPDGAPFAQELWSQALRVLKPGGHLLAFSGSRTYHRMVVAIEDAGFEIRDQIMWVYGSGYPKSLDVSKAIDKAGGQPWGTFASLLDGLIKQAGYNYTTLDRALCIPSAGSNSCYWVRTDERGGLPPRHYYEQLKLLLNPPPEFTDLYDKAEREVIAVERRKNAPSGIVGAGRESVDVDREITGPATDAAREWQGWGTALKPSHEPICMARKPLIGTVAQNVLAHGTGAINVDGCRVGTDDQENRSRPPRTPNAILGGGKGTNLTASEHNALGRFPANLIHDGSEEVLAAFPDAPGQGGSVSGGEPSSLIDNVYGDRKRIPFATPRNDSGSAARFFYTAKADADDRLGSKHPTVKPLDLMQYLVRLVTPRNGVCLDPFAGTGTTGEAAWREGMRAILIERDPEYQADIARRMDLAAQPTKRAAVAKTKNRLDDPNTLPLFNVEASE